MKTSSHVDHRGCWDGARLQSMQQSANEEIALTALRALQHTGDEHVLDAALKLLDHTKNEHVRLGLLQTLLAFKSPEASKKIKEIALNDPNMKMRLNAMRMLARTRSEGTMELLASIVFQDQESVRVYN